MDEDFYYYKKAVPLSTLKSWREEILSTAKWEHTGWSGDPKEPFRHWAYYPPVIEGTYLHIWDGFLSKTFLDHNLVLEPTRCILNSYNHGDSSWLHTDCDSSKSWTAIIYLNEYWDLNWGGETVIVRDGAVSECFSPLPGALCMFKSNLLHGPRPVSREAEFPRIGLTYQCIRQ